MKKRAFTVAVVMVCSAGVWSQSTERVDSSIRVSNAAVAPQSSVDILKKSVQRDSPFAAPAKAPKVPSLPKAVQPTAKPKETPAAVPPSSSVTPVKPAEQPAEKPAAQSTGEAPANAATSPTPAATANPPVAPSANTLDIPVTVGGKTTTVQTTVGPKPGPRRPKQPRGPRIQTDPVSQQNTTPAEVTPVEPEEETEEDSADAELEYARKLLEKSKQDAQQGRAIPPSAAKTKPSKVPSANKRFNPNAYRPGVEWIASKSSHFDIYTQKPNGQISSGNMALTFETAYETLRRFVPWMMSGRVRVFVYQDHDSYLRYEPEAKAWTRAIAYPTRGEIVVYDEPGHTQELKKTFAHELTHIFTQQFFDKHHTGRIMTPTWLDEGLAVLVEDQMFASKQGGDWDNDYRALRFERDPKTMTASFGSKSMFGGFQPKLFMPISQRTGANNLPRRGKPVRLQTFEDFMDEDSLDSAEGQGNLQNWYLQAYLMVRFLLNPAGGSSPSNRMQFEQFTRLVAEGEAVRNPSNGFLMKDSRGKQIYEPYDTQKALGRAYRYNTPGAFEDNFWKWLNK